MRLEEITAQALLTGIIPGNVVQVVVCHPIGQDVVNLVFKGAEGRLQERMLFRADETQIGIAVQGRPWGLDGSAADFKLARRGYRINSAHLFDPLMAVHTSNVEPLPHQITAVYEAMLPRQPLRFLLADDPGAGKTIMAGLFIRELMLRGDLERCLIVAPGSLVEQWQDELRTSSGCGSRFSPASWSKLAPTGIRSPSSNLLIARLDQLLAAARTLASKLEATRLGSRHRRRGAQDRRPSTSATRSRRRKRYRSASCSARSPATSC